MKLDECIAQTNLGIAGHKAWSIKLWFKKNRTVMGTGVGPIEGTPKAVAEQLRQLADQVDAIADREPIE